MKSFLETARLNQKVSYQILVLGSSLAVLISFAAEHLWKLPPCNLCFAQRLLYFALIVFGVTRLLSEMHWIQKMCRLTLFTLICVSSYHGLIQLGILQDRCQNKIKIEDAQSFKAALEKPISCLNASWKFLNIPASIWNVGIAFGFLTLLRVKNPAKKT